MNAKLRRLWSDMTTKDFATAIDPQRTVAILPVAAIEQHGPHLPVSVDAAICQAAIDRIVARAPNDLPITFLPLMAVGKSNEHLAFPGTLSLGAETLIRLWTEIGECVARAGVRKLVLLNSHGGQVQAMDIVARDLRVREKMFVVAASLWSAGLPQGLFSEAEERHGIHGGGVETSIMLHIRPDLVREEERAAFTPASIALEARYKHLRFEGAGVGFGWQTQDLNPSGAVGDALDADARRGALLIDHMADRLIELLREVSDYPLAALVDR
ncbi:MAG: creatininase family protein [Hyphomonadaceae bacterium]|nr:creatininase family protein [Hyphomonadaceae bacterium]